jgi:hypothetical protein
LSKQKKNKLLRQKKREQLKFAFGVVSGRIKKISLFDLIDLGAHTDFLKNTAQEYLKTNDARLNYAKKIAEDLIIDELEK